MVNKVEKEDPQKTIIIGEHVEVGESGIAIATPGGTAYAGANGAAIVQSNGDAEVHQYGLAACLMDGGTARGGHGVCAFVREGGDHGIAGTGDGGVSFVLHRGTAEVYHHGVAVAETNGHAVVGGAGSLAIVMNQSEQGSAMVGGDGFNQSLIIIRYKDPSDEDRIKFKIGVVGDNSDHVGIQCGLEPSVRYRLNDCEEFVPVEEPTSSDG